MEFELRNNAARRVGAQAGRKAETLWLEPLTKNYKYVFRQVTIKPSWGGNGVVADYVVGNDLSDLRVIDSKRTPWTGPSPAQREAYPKIAQLGGQIKDKSLVNLADPQKQSLKVGGKTFRGRVKPDSVHYLFEADLSGVASGQYELDAVLKGRQINTVPRPKAVGHLDLPGSAAAAVMDEEAGGRLLVSQQRPPTWSKRLAAWEAFEGTEVVARGASRMAVAGARGVRALGIFAYRMVIPPLTPQSILAEMIIYIVTSLIEHFFEKWEMEHVEEQLAKLPTMVEAKIKADIRTAAAFLQNSHTGFVYGYMVATVTRHKWQFDRAGGEDWSITLDTLEWSSFAFPGRMKPPVSRTSTARGIMEEWKETVVTFSTEEPLFTPFDHILGLLGWLEEELADVYGFYVQAPGGIGPLQKGVDSALVDRYRELQLWLSRLTKLLSMHRSIETLIGTERTGATRVAFLMEAEHVMKYLAPRVEAMVPAEPKQNAYPMFPSTQLTAEILAYIAARRRAGDKSYYPKRAKPHNDRTGGANFWALINWVKPPLGR